MNVKLARVRVDPIKRIIQLLSGKEKFDPKTLSDVSQLNCFSKIEVLLIMFRVQKAYIARNIKIDANKHRKLNLLDTVFKKIAYTVLLSIGTTKISSMNEEFPAIMCDPEVNAFNANSVIKERFDILDQNLFA